MTDIALPFGDTTLTASVPDRCLSAVLSPKPSRPVADLDAEITRALDRPIGIGSFDTWVRPTDRVLIISDDNTRLTPADRIIPALLDRLNGVGVRDEQIRCLMALGTHRYMTDAEIRAKVGDDVYGRIRVENHLWREPENLLDLGVSDRGTPIQVNKAVAEVDLVIGLGAVVPHHIPGFSGSSKIIQPGICGPRTTAETHMLACSGGGDSYLGLEDNPVRADMHDMARRVGMKAIFNVVMNSEGGVVGAVFGDMVEAFREATALARSIYGVPYDETPDIVVANAHPCELDFWQSHKAQYPAQRMVKPGGVIVLVTPAPEGVSPVHTELLDFTAWTSERIKEAYRRGELKNGVASALAVAWAMVREKADVIMFSPGIPPEDKKRLGHHHAPDLDYAIGEALRRQGPDARIAVLTHAPDLLPIPTR